MAKIVDSRFAALMNDDRGSANKKKNKKPQQNQPNKQQNQKQDGNKKNKKKANKKEQVNNNQSAAGTRPHLASCNSEDTEGSLNENTNNPDQWNNWVSKDVEFTDESYERDLQDALLLSRLEIEEQKQVKKPSKITENGGKTEDSQQSKKKKKKIMSLEQFKSTDLESKEKDEPGTSDSERPPTPTAKIHPQKANDKYFNKVEDDVNKILRKEKIQEEYKKHYIQENVMASKYQEIIEKRDEEIETLHEQYNTLVTEHKKVKKRNKQLCFILAEGEMKDKTEVLLHVEELSQVKDELTDQVTELTAELEKERSKVHVLKAELEKLKGKVAR